MEVSDFALLGGMTIRNGLADEPPSLGAGMHVTSDAVMVWMNFVNNSADLHGAGMSLDGNGTVEMVASRFLGNVAGNNGTGVGGAIQVWSGTIAMSGIEFIGNRSDQGGAIHHQSATQTIEIVNSTFADNSSGAGQGGAIGAASDVSVENSIFHGNTGGSTALGPITINNSIFEGGWSGTGTGNLDVDPEFLDVDGVDNLIGTLDDNARLASNSPAIDAADQTECQSMLIVDTDYVDGDGDGDDECDMGARERGTMLVVDDDDNSPDVRPEMVNALVDAGMTFEWWNTGDGTGDEPTANELAAHSKVFWFTGDHSTTADVVGPTSSAETALQTWLDSGNRCFLLSSLDYIYSRGNTPFSSGYLGLGSFNEDEDYTALTGDQMYYNESVNLWAGRFTDSHFGWSDHVSPDGTAKVLFSDANGNSVAIGKRTENYGTAFFGFSPASISADRYIATDERGKIIEGFFDECEQEYTCYATHDNGATIESSPDATAVQLAVNAASSGRHGEGCGYLSRCRHAAAP